MPFLPYKSAKKQKPLTPQFLYAILTMLAKTDRIH